MLAIFLCPLFVGICIGYFSGLSLVYQGKALTYSVIIPALRILGIATFGLLLLHWGTIPFILFMGSLIITMWIVILTHNE